MAGHGLPRSPWQGPRDYAEALAARFPEHAAELREICTLYARLRFGPHAPEHGLRILQNRIASLRLK